MAVPYKNPNDLLDAAEWNLLLAQNDELVTKYLSGMSPLLLQLPPLFTVGVHVTTDAALNAAYNQRLFFFFNPKTPPSNLHPLAQAAITMLFGLYAPGYNCYFRQYDHAAIVNYIDSLPVDSANVVVAAIAISNPATGYAANQVIALVGGTGTAATIKVDTVGTGGKILTAHLLTSGLYSVAPPAGACPVSVGSASFNLTLSGGVAPVSNDFQVKRLAFPLTGAYVPPDYDIAAWNAAVYPAATSLSLGVAAPNLDICLSVLKRGGWPICIQPTILGIAVSGVTNGFTNTVQNGTTGWNIGTVEHIHQWDEIDLIIAGNLTFDAAWDKYNLFRIHNFSKTAATVTFADTGSTVTVPAAGMKCVRRDRVGGTYTTGFNYYNRLMPGDPRFFWLSASVSGGVMNPMAANILALLQNARQNQIFGTYSPQPLDPSKFWDAGAVDVPSFAPASFSTLVGDLIVHKGDFLAVRYGASGNTVTTFVTLTMQSGGGGFVVGQIYTITVSGKTISPAQFRCNSVTGAGNALATFTMLFGGYFSSTPTGFQGSSGQTGGQAIFVYTTGLTVVPSVNEAKRLTFGGFATLAAVLAQANSASAVGAPFTPGIDYSFDNARGAASLAVQLPAQTNLDLIDVGTNLFTFLGLMDNAGSFYISSIRLLASTGSVFVVGQTYPLISAAALPGFIFSPVTTSAVILVTAVNGAGALTGFKLIIDRIYGLTGALTNATLYVGTPQTSFQVTTGNRYVPRLSGLNTSKLSLSIGQSPAGFSRDRRLVSSNAETVTGYNLYTFDGTHYHFGAHVSVSVFNQTVAFDPADTTYGISFSLLDTPQKMLDCINQLATAFCSIQNAKVMHTSYGPVLLWQEAYTPAAGFAFTGPGFGWLKTDLGYMRDGYVWIKFLGGKLVVQRYFYIASAFLGNPFPDPTNPANDKLWNFPRAERRYGARRVVSHDGNDEPWQTRPVAYTTLEPPNVKRYFENKPASTESPEPLQSGTSLTPFKRLGPMDVLPVIGFGAFPWTVDTSTILLGIWIAGGCPQDASGYNQYLRAIGASQPSPAEIDKVNNTNSGSVLQLAHQCEQYNMAASQSNGLVPPPAKRQVAPIGNDNYTLDFSFIFLVNGGSHYQVGDAVQVGNVGSAIPATIIVDSVVTDSFGTTGVIATWHLSGTPITAQPYHALSSPARPFTSTGGHGSGATWDVSRGDGSQLSFIPAYAPAVVPVPTGLTGVYWPRNTFFSWSGATPGGADPVADYFTSKGVAVQSTLPDGYGTPQLKRYGYVDVNGVVTVQDGVPPDYMLGFTPAFQTKAGTYRWISIDAARSFYATENIPFVCPATAATILSFIKNQDWSVEVISVDGPHVLPAPFPPLPFDVNSAGFVPVADGNWLTTLIIPILPGPLPLVRPIFVQRNLSVIFVGSYIISVLLQPFGYIFQASLAVSIVAENTVPVVVYCMPKNYASSDPSAFIHASRANLDAYNELGDSIVPVAADNSVEGHAPEATYIDGVGGAGAHETVIVTGLACATLSIVPVTGNS